MPGEVCSKSTRWYVISTRTAWFYPVQPSPSSIIVLDPGDHRFRVHQIRDTTPARTGSRSDRSSSCVRSTRTVACSPCEQCFAPFDASTLLPVMQSDLEPPPFTLACLSIKSAGFQNAGTVRTTRSVVKSFFRDTFLKGVMVERPALLLHKY